MIRSRLWDRRSVRRIAVVDAFPFPSSVRQRFAFRHGDLTADQIQTAEAATRQWFRLAGPNPKAKLSMPSVVVDDMWHELVLHTREYADFCQEAFGRFLHHAPESAMSSPAAAANRSTDLLNKLRLARHDEGCGPQQLPLLFRVDQELAVAGGRRYLADCGGRGECFEVRGTLCLQHLTGLGKPLRSHGGSNGAAGHSFGCGTADGPSGCGSGGD